MQKPQRFSDILSPTTSIINFPFTINNVQSKGFLFQNGIDETVTTINNNKFLNEDEFSKMKMETLSNTASLIEN